jgi:glutathione S-transferase
MSGGPGPLQLYQAEWCPFSHRVRARLTELGLDFVARQVAPDPAGRTAMAAETGGATSIPTLVTPEGRVISEADVILAHLDETYREPRDAAEHRSRAAADWPLFVRMHERDTRGSS